MPTGIPIVSKRRVSKAGSAVQLHLDEYDEGVGTKVQSATPLELRFSALC